MVDSVRPVVSEYELAIGCASGVSDSCVYSKSSCGSSVDIVVSHIGFWVCGPCLNQLAPLIGVTVSPSTLPGGAVESPVVPDPSSERIPIFADVSTAATL